MRWSRSVNVMGLFSFILIIMTSSLYAAGDREKGKEIFSKKCVACHGKNGEGNKSQKAPKLAGQFDWYIVTQLNNFQKGVRNNPKMLPFIKTLTEKDFQNLGAYLNSLPH